MGVEYDVSFLDTLFCWHFTVSVVVIQQFVESVTCLICVTFIVSSLDVFLLLRE